MKLWCDLKTDRERAQYFRSGDAWKAGIIARAIEKETADAFYYKYLWKKLLEVLTAYENPTKSKEIG